MVVVNAQRWMKMMKMRQTDINGIFAEETVHGDSVVLTDAVTTVLSLLVVLRVERDVIEYDRGCAREIEAQTRCFCRQQEQCDALVMMCTRMSSKRRMRERDKKHKQDQC